jgi:pimeloyl-ACP methyl ester carboxylesterase
MPEVKTNGIEMHCVIRGKGDPLILLMGLGADGSVWEQHTVAYETRYGCVVVDNRGVGQSDKPPGPYTTAMMADDVAGLMNALRLERAHISGVSMGACIAQELALRHPARVRSLTLNCPWPRCDAYARLVFLQLKALYGQVPPQVWARHLNLLIFAPRFHAEHPEVLQDRERQAVECAAPQPPQAFAAQCEACLTHDTLDRLSAVAAPTLITVGEADIFTPLRFSRAIADRIRGSELAVFADCGHAHHWERLEEFNARTLAFMKAH